ncbi:hypothetical protein M408DRAFT_307358, partial [Serendipita vermifera MAFF 305830]
KIRRKHLARYSWLPDVFRYDRSVIPNIAGPVLTVTIFASYVLRANCRVLGHPGTSINLTNNVVPLLSVVVGLILVFRTSYDRWNEGRRDFAVMQSNIRNLSRNIWTAVQLPPPLPRTASGSSSNQAHHAAAAQNLAVAEHLKNEKIRVIKLLIAFAVASKHHLREEPGLSHEDFEGLLPPELYREEASGWERTISTSPDHIFAPTTPINPGQSKPRFNIRKPTASTPLLTDSQRTVEYHAYHERKHMPLPLIIAHEVSRALYRFKRFSCLDVVGYAMHNGMHTILQSMVDQLTAMERVGNTPIPARYSIHLKQCVTLYLFALPFILVHDLGFTMIPVVTVVAFTLMGIEGIADEIEHPFGKHPNSHPLDRFCAELREEVMFMIERVPEGLDEDE